MPTADEIRDGQRATWARLSSSWETWDSIITAQMAPVRVIAVHPFKVE